MSNLRLSYLQKVGGGGMFVQAIPPPHPKKWGEGRGIHGGGYIPPPRIYASDIHTHTHTTNQRLLPEIRVFLPE